MESWFVQEINLTSSCSLLVSSNDWIAALVDGAVSLYKCKKPGEKIAKFAKAEAISVERGKTIGSFGNKICGIQSNHVAVKNCKNSSGNPTTWEEDKCMDSIEVTEENYVWENKLENATGDYEMDDRVTRKSVGGTSRKSTGYVSVRHLTGIQPSVVVQNAVDYYVSKDIRFEDDPIALPDYGRVDCLHFSVDGLHLLIATRNQMVLFSLKQISLALSNKTAIVGTVLDFNLFDTPSALGSSIVRCITMGILPTNDGNAGYAAVAVMNRVVLIEYMFGQPKAVFSCNGLIRALACSGKWILTMSDEKVFRLWDVTSLQLVFESSIGSSCGICASFDPKLPRFVIGFENGSFCFFDIVDGKNVSVRIVHGDTLVNLCSRNSVRSNFVNPFDVQYDNVDLHEPFDCNADDTEISNKILSLSFCNGRLLITTSTGLFFISTEMYGIEGKILTVSDGFQMRSQLNEQPNIGNMAKVGLIRHACISNQNGIIIASSFHPSLTVLNTKKLDIPLEKFEHAVHPTELFETSPLTAKVKPILKVNPSDKPVTFGRKIASSGYGTKPPVMKMFGNSQKHVKTKPALSEQSIKPSYPNDCSALLMHQKQHNLPDNLHHGAIFRVNYSPDCSKLLTCSIDNTARVSKLPFSKYGGSGFSMVHSAPVVCASWSSDANFILTSSKSLRIWNGSDSNLEIVNPLGDFGDCSFFYRDQFLIGCTKNCISLYGYYIDKNPTVLKNETRSTLIYTKEFDCQSITSLSCENSLSTCCMLALSNRSLQLLDLNTCQVVRSYDGHTKSVDRVLFENGMCITNARDNTMRLWDARTSKCIRSFEGHCHKTQPIGAAFSPCGRFLCCGSEDKAAYMYDIGTSSVVGKLIGHSDVVTDVDFHLLHPQVVTVGYDAKIKFYSE